MRGAHGLKLAIRSLPDFETSFVQLNLLSFWLFFFISGLDSSTSGLHICSIEAATLIIFWGLRDKDLQPSCLPVLADLSLAARLS